MHVQILHNLKADIVLSFYMSGHLSNSDSDIIKLTKANLVSLLSKDSSFETYFSLNLKGYVFFLAFIIRETFDWN